MKSSDSKLVEAVKDQMRRRSAPGKGDEFLKGVARADVRHLRNLALEGRVREFRFPIDEPSDLAGENTGPNPLGYFIAGAASCYVMQLIRVAMTRDSHLEAIEVSARGHFNRAVNGTFEEIVYDLRIDGEEDASAVLELVEEAKRYCYVYNTMVRAGVKMTTITYLNGRKISVQPVRGG